MFISYRQLNPLKISFLSKFLANSQSPHNILYLLNICLALYLLIKLYISAFPFNWAQVNKWSKQDLQNLTCAERNYILHALFRQVNVILWNELSLTFNNSKSYYQLISFIFSQAKWFMFSLKWSWHWLCSTDVWKITSVSKLHRSFKGNKAIAVKIGVYLSYEKSNIL